MDYALLNKTGLRMSRIVLGTALLGLAPDEQGADELIGTALDLGINVFDCANTYGNRSAFDRDGLPPAEQRKHAEELLGRALKGHRDEVVLCTKVSEPVGQGANDGGVSIPGVGGQGGGLSRFHIMREVERSLQRLNTDHIDIYHMHHPDPDTSIDETLRAMDDLVHQGKVRYVAMSTYAGWQMTKAVTTAERYGLARPVLNQIWYNLITRGPEAEVIPAAVDLGVSLTCFSPLAGGALAGAAALNRPYGGFRRWGLPFDYTADQKDAAGRLDGLSQSWGVDAAHLALQWLLSQPMVVSAIVGPETPTELKAAIGALDVTLDQEQLTALGEIGQGVPTGF